MNNFPKQIIRYTWVKQYSLVVSFYPAQMQVTLFIYVVLICKIRFTSKYSVFISLLEGFDLNQ